MKLSGKAALQPGSKRARFSLVGLGALTGVWMLGRFVADSRQPIRPVPYAVHVFNVAGSPWCSDHQVLAYPPSPVMNCPVSVLDTRTGQHTPLKLCDDATAFENMLDHDIAVSPDGKWVLQAGYGNPRRAPVWILARTDNSDRKVLPRGQVHRYRFGVDEGRPALFAWLPDSRQWVDLCLNEGGSTAIVYNLDGTVARKREYDFPSNGCWLKLLRVTAQGRLIALRNGTELTINELNSGASVRQLPFPPLPNHVRSVGDECAVSPDGNRVAYVTDAVEPDPFLARFARWLPPGMLGWRRVRQIQISRLDGSDARRVADIDGYFDSRCTLDLEWLPDGKRLSFCGRPQTKDGPILYTVAVD